MCGKLINNLLLFISPDDLLSVDSKEAVQLKAEIDTQGSKVREAKSANATKDQVDSEVQKLLALKAKYKEMTGEDLTGGAKKGKVRL